MKTFYTLLLSILVIGLGSCKKKEIASSLHDFIPAETQTAVSINLGSLASKANVDQWGTLNMFKDYMDGNESFLGILGDLAGSSENTGIDLNKKSVMFTRQGTWESGMALAINLNSAEKFSNYLESMGMKKQSANFPGTLMQDPSGVGSCGFTENAAIISFGPKASQTIESCFALKKAASLTENENFQDFISKGGDLSVWQNGVANLEMLESLGRNIGGGGPVEDLMEDLLGLLSHTHYSFDKGKLALEGTLFPKGKLEQLYESMFSGSVESDLLDLIPGNRSIAAFSMSLDLESILEEVQDIMGLEDDMQFGILGSTIESSLSGDIVMALTGISDGSFLESQPQFIMAIGLKNSGSLEMLLGMASLDKDSETGYYRIDDDFQMRIIDDAIVMGNDLEALKGNETKLDQKVRSQLKSGNGGFYFDFKSEALGLEKIISEEIAKMGMDMELLERFKRIDLDNLSGSFKDLDFNLDLNLGNDSENPLWMILQLLDLVYTLNMDSDGAIGSYN